MGRNERDPNALRFSIVSFALQIMIVTMILAAQSGTALMDNIKAGTFVDERIGIIETSGNETFITKDTRMATDTGNPLAFNPVDFAMNIASYLNIFWTVVKSYGFAFATVGAWIIPMSGAYGFIITLMILAWQIAAIYYLLKFMFPGRI